MLDEGQRQDAAEAHRLDAADRQGHAVVVAEGQAAGTR